jgi:hypothetical protein
MTIKISTSGIVDTNNISQSANAAILRRLSCLLDDDTVNVIQGSNLKSYWEDPVYFNSAFLTLLPYGTGKHIDSRASTSSFTDFVSSYLWTMLYWRWKRLTSYYLYVEAYHHMCTL